MNNPNAYRVSIGWHVGNRRPAPAPTPYPLEKHETLALIDTQARRLMSAGSSLLREAKLVVDSDFPLACEMQAAGELLSDQAFAHICNLFVKGKETHGRNI